MAKSSINFQKSSSQSSTHNTRIETVNYLISDSKYNYYSCDSKQRSELEKQLFQEASENHKKTFGQKLQSKSFNWEAVVNLNKNHKAADLKKLIKEIEKETGFKATQFTIHRDEGVLKKGDKTLKAGVDIFLNQTDNKFYLDKDFKKLADVEGFGKVHNFHAHINFFTLDKKTGINLWKRTFTEAQLKRNPDLKAMNRTRLSKLQDITAQSLGMERGAKGAEATRMSAKQYKAHMSVVDELKSEIKDLKKQLTQKQVKEQTKGLLATAQEALRAKLIPKELFWEMGKTRKLISSQNELDVYVSKYQIKLKELKVLKNELEQKDKDLSEALQATKTIKDVLSHTKEALEASKARESDLSYMLSVLKPADSEHVEIIEEEEISISDLIKDDDLENDSTSNPSKPQSEARYEKPFKAKDINNFIQTTTNIRARRRAKSYLNELETLIGFDLLSKQDFKNSADSIQDFKNELIDLQDELIELGFEPTVENLELELEDEDLENYRASLINENENEEDNSIFFQR